MQVYSFTSTDSGTYIVSTYMGLTIEYTTYHNKCDIVSTAVVFTVDPAHSDIRESELGNMMTRSMDYTSRYTM